MNLDNLLLWLSATRRGSWGQFRSAVERLHIEPSDNAVEFDDGVEPTRLDGDLPLYHRVRYAMQRLGHVEFFADEVENGWRIVPPSVVLPSVSSAHALLCGARSPELLENLHSLPDIDVSITASHGGPNRICLRGLTPQLIAQNMTDLGFHIQRAASTTILCTLPGARDSSTWQPSSIPDTGGWDVFRFSRSRLRWTEDSQTNAARAAFGLFRFRLGFQRLYFLRWRGRCFKVNVQVGKYAVLRRRPGLLQYTKRDRTLTVLPICRPPPLIERALILCSGLLPRIDENTRRLQYTDVPLEVVRIAAHLLAQEVR